MSSNRGAEIISWHWCLNAGALRKEGSRDTCLPHRLQTHQKSHQRNTNCHLGCFMTLVGEQGINSDTSGSVRGQAFLAKLIRIR